VTKAIAHRRDAEPAEVFIKKFSLCGEQYINENIP
jgi:hypothetical protein